MVNISRGGLYVLNDNIERAVKPTLRAGINAGGNRRTAEFVSTKGAATMNARMKVRQFALRPIRVARHLSLASFQCYASVVSDLVLTHEREDTRHNMDNSGKEPLVYVYVVALIKSK